MRGYVICVNEAQTAPLYICKNLIMSLILSEQELVRRNSLTELIQLGINPILVCF